MKKLVICLILLLPLVACKKAELKKPTAVKFGFGLNKSFGENSAVKMTQGYFNLTEFNVIGDRIEGDDIFFTRSFDNGLNISLTDNGNESELDFDVPQGSYQSIVLEFKMDADNEPSLVLTGNYKPSQGPVLNLRFEYTASTIFSIQAENKDGDYSIIMDADKGNRGLIQFNPIYWFDGLTANQLDNATITPQQGTDLIVISDTENIALYEIVIERMIDANQAIFTE